VTRLRKRDAEALMSRIDVDPLEAVCDALGRVLDRPGAPWAQLLADAPFDDDRRRALAAGDLAALHDLAAELNERREL
jgi:hypothetical protein